MVDGGEGGECEEGEEGGEGGEGGCGGYDTCLGWLNIYINNSLKLCILLMPLLCGHCCFPLF